MYSLGILIPSWYLIIILFTSALLTGTPVTAFPISAVLLHTSAIVPLRSHTILSIRILSPEYDNQKLTYFIRNVVFSYFICFYFHPMPCISYACNHSVSGW